MGAYRAKELLQTTLESVTDYSRTVDYQLLIAIFLYIVILLLAINCSYFQFDATVFRERSDRNADRRYDVAIRASAEARRCHEEGQSRY